MIQYNKNKKKAENKVLQMVDYACFSVGANLMCLACKIEPTSYYRRFFLRIKKKNGYNICIPETNLANFLGIIEEASNILKKTRGKKAMQQSERSKRAKRMHSRHHLLHTYTDTITHHINFTSLFLFLLFHLFCGLSFLGLIFRGYGACTIRYQTSSITCRLNTFVFLFCITCLRYLLLHHKQ